MPSNHSTSGIYAIRHLASGKMYIGSAVNIFKRWGEHRRALTGGEHHSRYLARAWMRYGPDAFVWEILQLIENPADLIRVEQEYLDRFGTWQRMLGYNISPTAGSCLGMKHTPQTRSKMSAIRKGRPSRKPA